MKLHYLWNIDPGYFHLKHATKTVVAILISLWLMRDEALFTQMMASIACGFSMQGVVAKAFSSRIKQVIVLDVAYFLVFALGLCVRDSVSWRACVLVLLGFFANYVRRFGLQTSVAPMMGWTLCFFATTLPFPNQAQAWNHIYGLVVGLGVSASMVLLIFPENYPRLFVKNTNRLFDLLAEGMRELRRQTPAIDGKSNSHYVESERISHQLTYLLESNQTIEQSDVFGEQSTQISEVLIQEYALVHAYRMMIDAYRILSRHDYSLSRATRLELTRHYKTLEKTLGSLRMAFDYSISCRPISVGGPVARWYRPVPLPAPALIMVILNVKLGFDLLEQHMSALLRGSDAH